MNNSLLQPISSEVWKHQIFPYNSYADYVSWKRTCRFMYKVIMNSCDSKRLEVFLKFCQVMHRSDHDKYLFTYLEPINVMPFSCRTSNSLPDYSAPTTPTMIRTFPNFKTYYFNWEEFDYFITVIPHNELKRIWDKFIVNPVFRGRLIISEVDKDGVSENIVNKILLKAIEQDSRKFNSIAQWISSTLPNLLFQISDMQDLVFKLILEGAPISKLSDRLRHNKEFITELLQYCNVPLNEIEEEFQYDIDVALISVANDPNNYTYLSNAMRCERSITIQMINHAYKIKDFTNTNKAFVKIFEKFIPIIFRNDREIMELSIKQDSSIIPMASDALKNNKEFIANALNISTICFPHISLELRSDPDICLLALRNSKSKTIIMTHMNCLLLYDEDFMREIVSIDGMLLSYAPNAEISQNRDIVLTAVKQNPFALQYADKQLRNDEEIVREAILQDGETIMFASEIIRDNFELMSIAVNRSKVALLYASERLKSDENLVSISVYNHPSSVKFASQNLIQNTQFIEHLIRNCPSLTQQFKHQLQIDNRNIEDTS